MRGKKTWLILILFIGCALLVQCGARSPASLVPGTATPTPALEPAVSPSPIPTSTTVRVDRYEMRAWSLFSRTRVDSIQEVFAKLTRDGEGVAGAEMYVLVHYEDHAHRYPEQGTKATSEKGIASVDFPVADAHPEQVVLVDVYVTYDETTYRSAVSFMANC